MKKIKLIVPIILLILVAILFSYFNKKESIERCVIAYMDKSNQIQSTYVYDITYTGIFKKDILKINSKKNLISFDLNENLIEKYKNELEQEGKKLTEMFNNYTYNLKVEKNVNINLEFQSELNLINSSLENIKNTEYKNVLDKKNKLDFYKLKEYYKEQGAFCDNIKEFSTN